jgi:hypothetical protein
MDGLSLEGGGGRGEDKTQIIAYKLQNFQAVRGRRQNHPTLNQEEEKGF